MAKKNRSEDGADQLRRVLFDLKMTKQAMENLLGVWSGLVSRWVNRDRRPTLEQAVDMHKRFGIPVESWTRAVRKSA